MKNDCDFRIIFFIIMLSLVYLALMILGGLEII